MDSNPAHLNAKNISSLPTLDSLTNRKPTIMLLLLNKETLCEKLGISPRCLDQWVSQKRFPAPQRIGKRSFWKEENVERWQHLLFAPQDQWTPIDRP